ncbi:MAG: nitroreductase family protein [Candidatus Staskawiczbacteria bacterium]|nr:nitroreductase family protein [Candidatus Staskawiczbacteria bacterium]
MDNLFKIISTRRSIRRFDSNKNIDKEILKDIVELGSLAPSRLNMQPWQFIIVNEENIKNKIFENILWGSKNPANKIFSDIKYAPNSYVIILVDEKIVKGGYEYELGACAENMMIYAWSLGIGSVWLHSLNREKIISCLGIPEGFKLDSVVAMGYPKHISEIVELNDSCAYSVNDENNLNVPKRNIDKMVSYNLYGHN